MSYNNILLYNIILFIDFILIYFFRCSLMSYIKLFMLLPNYNNRVNHKFTFACYTTQSRQTVYFNEIFTKKKSYKVETIIHHNTNNNRCKVLQHLCRYGLRFKIACAFNVLTRGHVHIDMCFVVRKGCMKFNLEQ